jgi:asparagine N-glycosylation enzyme membrane subunit Stt3
MLLDRLTVMPFGWETTAWGVASLFGAHRVCAGFSAGRGNSVFWGTVLFLVALGFVLRELDLIEFRRYLMLPALAVVVGFGFLMTFFSRPREWHLIILALFFTGLGSLFLLDDAGFLEGWDVIWEVRRFWPVALILSGISLFLKRQSN